VRKVVVENFAKQMIYHRWPLPYCNDRLSPVSRQILVRGQSSSDERHAYGKDACSALKEVKQATRNLQFTTCQLLTRSDQSCKMMSSNASAQSKLISSRCVRDVAPPSVALDSASDII